MYNPNAAPIATNHAQQATEQVIFDQVCHHAQMVAGNSPIYARALQHMSSNNWNNQAILTAVTNTLDLLNVRATKFRGTPIESLIPECIRVVYSIIANAIAQSDTAWYHTLPPEVRRGSQIDLQMANIVDQEIAAFHAMQGTSAAANPVSTGGSGRGSIYSRVKPTTTVTGAVPAQVAVDIASPAYRPSRPGSAGVTSQAVGQQQTPALEVPEVKPVVVASYVPTRPGSTEKPIAPPVTVVPTKQAAATHSDPKGPEVKMTQFIYNPNTHMVKDGRIMEIPMDYNNHKPTHLAFPVISTSNESAGNSILEVAAGGLTFDPLSLVAPVPEGADKPAIPTAAQIAQNVVHYPQQVLASGHRHAELMIRSQVLDTGVSLNDTLLSYEYRDFNPIRIWATKEDASLAILGSKLNTLQDCCSVTDVHNKIGQLREGNALDLQVANIINVRATEFINEFMAFTLGLKGWRTTDFYGDWSAIIAALQKEYADSLQSLSAAFEQYQGDFITRTTASVFSDLDVETANVLNRIAGVTSPTLRQRIVTLSDLHAVFDIPLEASQLGIQPDAQPSLLTPNHGCELMYDAIAQFLSRLILEPSSYRTLTIVTADEYHIRIKPTEIACSETDTRRAIAVVSVRRD